MLLNPPKKENEKTEVYFTDATNIIPNMYVVDEKTNRTNMLFVQHSITCRPECSTYLVVPRNHNGVDKYFLQQRYCSISILNYDSDDLNKLGYKNNVLGRMVNFVGDYKPDRFCEILFGFSEVDYVCIEKSMFDDYNYVGIKEYP